MRKIDADELLEVLQRSDVSSRDKIEKIVKQQPTVREETLEKLLKRFLDLSTDHAQTSDYHRGKSHAYAIAADIVMMFAAEEGD